MAVSAYGQNTIFSLDSCRAMALSSNKDVHISSIDKQIAELEKKAAFSKYFPRINAMGTYTYLSEDIHLISDEQENKLRNAGTTVATQAGAYMQQLQSNPTFLQMLQANPQLAQAMQNFTPALTQNISELSAALSQAGNSLADALLLDTRNVFAAGVTLTQPLYMGGKIVAYNRITNYLEQVEENKHSLKEQELIVQVDQAYWQIINLQSKKKLAHSYLELINTLDGNVSKMVDNGFATRADALTVKVKQNEAEVTIIQIDNGLALSKMLLCQICGLPLDTQFTLADENNELDHIINVDAETADSIVTDRTITDRAELNSLELAQKIYNEKVKITRSEYLPNVALTGGYIITNPSCQNGFENKFNGMWTVGVGVKIPLVTSGERCFKMKAARLEAQKAEYKLDEAREKIELQVNQCAQRLEESCRRLATAKKSLDSADENLRFANIGMREGVVPVSNVLEAQTAWLKAQSTMIEAQIDVRLAKLNLDKAKGTLQY